MMATMWRRYPVTICAVALVVVCFALQWFLPLLPLLERQGAAIAGGEWWRLVSSFFVQGSGWGQFVFNTAGLIVLGAAVERVRGSVAWIATALVAQIGTVAVASLWAPQAYDSGSSFVVGGFVGLLTLARFSSPRWWVLTATAYRVFFVTYLAGFAVAGPIVGAVVGSVLTGATVAILNRSGLALWARRGVVVITVVATVVLIVWRDPHGVAVALGMIVAIAWAAIAPHRVLGERR
jgi:hypothetical protein